MKTKLMKSLPVLLIALAVIVGSVGISKAATSKSFLDAVARYAGVEVAQLLSSKGALDDVSEPTFGSAQTVATHVTSSNATNLGSLYLWDTDNNGGLEVDGYAWFDGTATFNGPVVGIATSSLTSLTVSNTTTLGRLIQGGTVTALTSVNTSTLTAAQICVSSLLTVSPVTNTPVLTLPPTSTLFVAASGGCLTADGQFVDLNFQAVGTSSIFAAGTGGTLLNSSSNTVAADKGAILRFIRNSATTYLVYLVNLVN